MNFAFDESKMKCDLTIKLKMSQAIDIEILATFENAEPSMDCTL
jgi:hypothetical protein